VVIGSARIGSTADDKRRFGVEYSTVPVSYRTATRQVAPEHWYRYKSFENGIERIWTACFSTPKRRKISPGGII